MKDESSFDIDNKTNPVQTVAPTNKEENEMLGATDKITALYCRLSVEDTKDDKKKGNEDPSDSIQHQQLMLMQYAKSNRFPNPTVFIDDGFSGVTYDRPGFQKMMAEIEAGNVSTVITKDLSRLGRNSALTGLYINYTFPQYGVRYIAVNDHFDTINPNSTDSDMAGIRNWFNEFFAKDTSRKIRAVNKAKGERGERLTVNVPYGYKSDPDDKTKWIIDEEAAGVVKRIFSLCMEGKGPSQIAALLEKEKVLNPTAYKQREGRKTPHQTPENEYRWHESTVAYILEYMEYTGCTVNFKTYTNSIWDKKQRETPVENRKVFYNTHPAIISLEVFDKVQEIRQQRHRRTATGKSSMFSGVVFCDDCKQKLYYSTTGYFEKRQDFFICSTHRVNKDKCSGHYIREVVLEREVWKHVQEVISVVTRYEAYFRSEMEQKLRLQSEEKLRVAKKRMAQAEKRIGELDRLFLRSYGDNVSGKIDDERFAMMNRNYTEEQKKLKEEVISLHQEIEEQERKAEDLEQFIQRVKRNSELTELTPYALHELVKAVYVEAPDKSSGKRKQKIHICYDLVGFIPVDILAKAEQA
ncbi:MAG: recombinase family protein [Clostridia bacterium]|nr:recombinase family protein [Clostridia bacterium]